MISKILHPHSRSAEFQPPAPRPWSASRLQISSFPGLSAVDVRQHQTRHFSRADAQHRLIEEHIKNSPRIFNRDAGHRYPPLAERRLAHHLLPHRRRPLKQRMQHRPGRPRLAGRIVCLAHLPKNLRLPQHHRIQRRRDGKQMRHHIPLAFFVQARIGIPRASAPRHPARNSANSCGLRMPMRLPGNVKFDAIARRKQHSLALDRTAGEAPAAPHSAAAARRPASRAGPAKRSCDSIPGQSIAASTFTARRACIKPPSSSRPSARIPQCSASPIFGPAPPA